MYSFNFISLKYAIPCSTMNRRQQVAWPLCEQSCFMIFHYKVWSCTCQQASTKVQMFEVISDSSKKFKLFLFDECRNRWLASSSEGLELLK